MTSTEFTAAKLANIDRAAADVRLSHLGFRLLWLMASAADRKTGVVRRRQTDLAKMLDCSRRAVQTNRDDLVRFGYVEPIGKRPGGYVSAYNVVKSKKAKLRSPSEKVGEKANVASPIGEPGFAQRRTAIRTNTSPLSSPFKNLPSAPTIQTAPGGPRGLEGLGPRPPAMGKLDADLRQRLGPERFQLLSMARLLPSDDPTVVRLSVLTAYQGDNIRKHCEADILAASGASKLEFTVELISTVPAKARVRP